MRKKHTTHLLNLSHVHFFSLPRVALQFLGVHLPLGQEANLQSVSAEASSLPRTVLHTICTGFSILRCALNSLLMYWSPSNRISGGRCLRCARSNLLYSGMGGNNAIGAGLKPLVDPAATGVAISSRGCTLMFLSPVVLTSGQRKYRERDGELELPRS
jgi:hypothetical protein